MGDAFLDVLKARDIGLGGIGVQVAHGFVGCNILDAVNLIIKLPARAAFKARGVIRHASQTQSIFGIEFVALSDNARVQIAAYVEDMKARGRIR